MSGYYCTLICVRITTSMSTGQPSECQICSYRQPSPNPKVPVFHRHNSARQQRILQKVEYEEDIKNYLCPTCQIFHPSRLDYGLNICASDSLHNFNLPEDNTLACPPDTIHVDWMTIPAASIAELEFAWSVDYHHQKLPSRTLVVAGLTDLINGGSKDSVMDSVKSFQKTVDRQNRHHPEAKNQFAIAPLPFPPKLAWFSDDGPLPNGHSGSREDEIADLNEMIFNFNAQNGLPYAPHFNTLGVRRYKKWYDDGSWRMIIHHRIGQWTGSELVHERTQLADPMRIRMSRMVVKYFEGEMSRENGPISRY